MRGGNDRDVRGFGGLQATLKLSRMPVEVTLIDRRNFHLFLPLATWLTVHLFYLIGFENRLLVPIRWSFSFATHGRGARPIAGDDGR